MYEKILVPLDGSNIAEAVLPDVERLAKNPATKVVLLTVEPKGAVGPKPVAGSVNGRGTSTMERVDCEHRVYLAAVAERLANKGVTVETVLVPGHVAEEILDYAKNYGCDLIAMCTHGRSGMKRGLIGSVTDEVVRGAEVPVLAVGPNGLEGKHLDGGIKRIAVPLDGSSLAEEVLPHVERLAEEMSLEVVLLRVVRMTPWVYGGHEIAPLDLTEVEESLELEAKEYLEAIGERFTAKGIKNRREVLNGIPWDRIITYAKESDDTMVGISTHGRSGLPRLVLGSVADMVIRSLDTPALIVRPS